MSDKSDKQIPAISQRHQPAHLQGREIWLAGGCFWGTQAYLDGVPGVLYTDVGYANGTAPSPSYEAVCTGKTGYAETVHVVYNGAQISLRFLLDLYFQSVDPTAFNRQGGDVGEQYRTGIYYTDPRDLPAIRDAVHTLSEGLDKPVAIEIAPLRNYYRAEEYHQRYLEKNPRGYCHISPQKIQQAHTARDPKRPEDEALREKLTPLQYEVTQHNATEPPFENEYHDKFEPGIYVDITTGQPLFLSTDKFESGCGWPAFSKPITQALIRERLDTSYGRERTEVRSAGGDAHLGHVFPDGPEELGGMRYCINSAALRFVHRDDMEQQGYGEWLKLLEGK